MIWYFNVLTNAKYTRGIHWQHLMAYGMWGELIDGF